MIDFTLPELLTGLDLERHDLKMDTKLTPDLDREILALTHEQALGVIRAIVHGEWMSPDAIRLGMRVQRSACPESHFDESSVATDEAEADKPER